MIKIYPKTTDIPIEIVKKCQSLSYRKQGLLCEYLNHARKYHDRGYNGVVSIAYDPSYRILGWGARFNWYDYHCNIDTCLLVYVRNTCRRLGLGKMLVNPLFSKVKSSDDIAVHGSKAGGGNTFWLSFNDSRLIIQ